MTCTPGARASAGCWGIRMRTMRRCHEWWRACWAGTYPWWPVEWHTPWPSVVSCVSPCTDIYVYTHPFTLHPSHSPLHSPPLTLTSSLSTLHSPSLTLHPSLSPSHNSHTASGEVFSWGSGFYGRLGHGNLRDRFSPLMIGAPLRGQAVTYIACHEYHSAAVCGEYA